MTENEYLEMPWSIEDTIENLNEIKENFKVILINKNLDGKAYDDVKELEFDFDRAIKALENQMPKKLKEHTQSQYGCIPVCGVCNGIMDLMQGDLNYCPNCGQKLNWESDEK